ncbi:MAG: winged helix-turn-helix domain-containing protein [Bacteroidales bacterium]|nr:winged helix-turn-helix domain-containing protein [Bacteroidales bacterium]
MTRVRKGNILLKLSELDLQRSLQLYFERKYYNVFCPQTKRETDRIKRQYAITFAIFDIREQRDGNIESANSLLDFDDKTVIYFICENDSSKLFIETTNPVFHTIKKPLVMRSLLARMLNDAENLQVKENNRISFSIGKYKLNVRTSILQFRDGDIHTDVHLTKKECMILQKLCISKGKVVSRHRLLTDIWRKDDYQTARCMDVYMTRLRKYLLKDENVTIDNIHSIGYMINVSEKQ